MNVDVIRSLCPIYADIYAFWPMPSLHNVAPITSTFEMPFAPVHTGHGAEAAMHKCGRKYGIAT